MNRDTRSSGQTRGQLPHVFDGHVRMDGQPAGLPGHLDQLPERRAAATGAGHRVAVVSRCGLDQLGTALAQALLRRRHLTSGNPR